MGGIFSLEARDMDTKLLSAPESNNTLARLTVTGSRLLPVVGPLSLQFLVRWPTLLQGGSISPEGFLSSVLLWLVIIIAVVGVVVTVIVFIIVAVVVVAVERSSVVKLFLRFIGSNVPFNTLRQSQMKTSIIFSESSTIVGHKVASSWNLLTSYGPYSQMVKFVFHLLDLSSGMILLYQNLLEFNLGELLFSSVAIGICQHLPLLSMLGIHAARNTISNEFLMQPESRWCIRVERSF
ncbi:hypothetical protein Tco_1212077 [Tanacetum coccineum]